MIEDDVTRVSICAALRKFVVDRDVPMLAAASARSRAASFPRTFSSPHISITHELAKKWKIASASFSGTSAPNFNDNTLRETASGQAAPLPSDPALQHKKDHNEHGEWHLHPPHPSASSSSTPAPVTRLKHPTRGGQNLSGRYVRLERALRGKEAYEKEIDELEEEEESTRTEADVKGKGRAMGTAPFVFHGYTIPEEPKPPGPDG